MKIELRRAQIGKYDGPDAVDVTVKSAADKFKPLAPTWDMVNGIKNGKMDKEEYTRLYRAILEEAPWQVWGAVDRVGRIHKRITFMCYCPDGSFCHTLLLIDYMLGRWPKFYYRKTPRKVETKTETQTSMF